MFTSKALQTVGLVWKPIRPKATTKRNARASLQRVKANEEFLSKYELKRWGKTQFKRAHQTKDAPLVSAANWEAEAAKQAVIDAKRARIVAKKQSERDAKLQKEREEANQRQEAAQSLLEKLRQSGYHQPFPTL